MSRLKPLYDKAKKVLFGRIMLHASYKRVFETPDGQEVLTHICKVAHLSKSTFVAGDPYETAMNEGRRKLALEILRFVRKDHREVIDMVEKQLDEHNEE